MPTMLELVETGTDKHSASLHATWGAWLVRNIWVLVLAASICLWSLVGADFYLS